MAQQQPGRRVEVLSRHLTSAVGLESFEDVAQQLTEDSETHLSADFSPRALYLWATRDNVEMRDQMMEFLKVPSRLLMSATSAAAMSAECKKAGGLCSQMQC